jgi:hypothetical protein
MRQVFTSVQPISPEHPRAGQAGTVCSVPADDPAHVGVKWDVDGDITAEACADLRILG